MFEGVKIPYTFGGITITSIKVNGHVLSGTLIDRHHSTHFPPMKRYWVFNKNTLFGSIFKTQQEQSDYVYSN